METKRETGDQYEDIALDHLQRQGLKLIKRNHLCKGGELDLVMLDGDTLALVEVRFRRDRLHGGAAASVNATKRKRIVIAAKHLLHTRSDLKRFRARFDLVAIEFDQKELKIEWIKSAFRV